MVRRYAVVFIILAFLAMLFLPVTNCDSTGWFKTLGLSGNDFARFILLDNGKIFVYGRSYSAGSGGGYEGFIALLEPNSSVIWQKHIQSTDGGEVRFLAALNTSDGYYVGGDISVGNDVTDALLVKFDKSGRLLWAKKMSINTYNVEYVKAIFADENYIYLLINGKPWGYEVYFVKLNKTDLSLEQIAQYYSEAWNRDRDDVVHKAFLKNGVIYAVVRGEPYEGGSCIVFLEISTETGKILKSRSYSYSTGYSIALLNETTRVFVGVSSNHPIVGLLNSDYRVIWVKYFNDTKGWASDVSVDREGNIYVIGSADVYGSGFYDTFIAKVSPKGNLIWFKTVGGSNNDYGSQIVVFNTNGYVASGHTRTFTYAGDEGTYSDFFILADMGNYIGNLEWINNDYGENVTLNTIYDVTLVNTHLSWESYYLSWYVPTIEFADVNLEVSDSALEEHLATPNQEEPVPIPIPETLYTALVIVIIITATIALRKRPRIFK